MPMEVCEHSARQCGELEKGIISFLPKSGDRKLQHCDLILHLNRKHQLSSDYKH